MATTAAINNVLELYKQLDATDKAYISELFFSGKADLNEIRSVLEGTPDFVVAQAIVPNIKKLLQEARTTTSNLFPQIEEVDDTSFSFSISAAASTQQDDLPVVDTQVPYVEYVPEPSSTSTNDDDSSSPSSDD